MLEHGICVIIIHRLCCEEEIIMERKGEMTKALLGQKFKELVVKKSFDKITIKMITDEAG